MRPVLFSLGSVDFFASPVFAGLSAVLAAVYVFRQRGAAGLGEEQYWSFMLCMAFGTFGSGVVLYFFLYGGGWERNWEYFLKYRNVKGGAFYGNYWGAILTTWLFARWAKLDFRKLADTVATAAPLALALMRWGCLQHACCFGKPASVPWAVVFTDPRGAIRNSLLGTPLHPSQLYESAGNLLIFLLLHFVVRKRIAQKALPDGAAFLTSTALYAVLRLTLARWRGSDPGIFTPFGFTTAQTIAFFSLIFTLWLARRWKQAA